MSKLPDIDIHEILAGKWQDGTRPKDLYDIHISRSPDEFLKAIIYGLGAEKRKVQSGCAELASLLSEDRPDLLYPYLDHFIENLTSKAPVLRWEAVCCLGNLASVDKRFSIPATIETIVSFLNDKSIVLQVHSVRALGKIARAYPEAARNILDQLMRHRGSFPGNRIGFVIETMEYFKDIPEVKEDIREFVMEYMDNDIRVVASKARKTMMSL
ncbi:MAG: HEAT repeat domain-containing protein [Candidatus Thorarchaeota archaeon]